jgi:hypothetical protein
MQVGYILPDCAFVRACPVRRHIHSRGCFYPAAGYRNRSNGALDYVGSNGFYWSSSPNGSSSGYFLSFSSTSVTPSNSYSRSYGFLARCIAAFITVFFYMIGIVDFKERNKRKKGLQPGDL